MRYTVPFVSVWLVAAVLDVRISGQASMATPPGAEACAVLAPGKVAGLATLSATYDSGSNTAARTSFARLARIHDDDDASRRIISSAKRRSPCAPRRAGRRPARLEGRKPLWATLPG
jgi:hypothetical protein